MITLFGTSLKGECRPCYIIRKDTNTKALFHCWCSLVDMGRTDSGAGGRKCYSNPSAEH